MGHDFGEVAANTFSDFDWARRNEKALFEKYGRCIAIIYQEQVLGTGQTYQEAVEDAERNLPPEYGVVTPILVFVHQRQPFYRVRPQLLPNDE